MKDIDPARFVFVDECGTNITLTRLYARAPREESEPSARFRETGIRT